MGNSIIFGHSPTTAVNNSYTWLFGGWEWSHLVAAGQRVQVITTPGCLENLLVYLPDAPGVGESCQLILQVNGVDTALTVTIAGTDTIGFNLTDVVSVVAGDTVGLLCLRTGGLPYPSWALIFEATNVKESLILGSNLTATGGSRYSPISTAGSYPATAEADAIQICPTSGVIKNLYINLSSDPGSSSAKGYTFTLRKNIVDTALTVTLLYQNRTGNDTTHEVSVVAGDRLCLVMTPVGGTSWASNVRFGMTFLADTDGENILFGGDSTPLHTTATEWNELVSHYRGGNWTGSEIAHDTVAIVCTLEKLYVYLDNPPGAGKSYTFTVRKNYVDTDLTVTISDSSTTGSDTTHTVSISAWDMLTLQCVPSGTPTGAEAKWGLVCSSALGVVYPDPSEATIRVTGLIHRWFPGTYTLEITLGAITTEFGLPWWSKEPAPPIPPDEPSPPPTPVEPDYPTLVPCHHGDVMTYMGNTWRCIAGTWVIVSETGEPGTTCVEGTWTTINGRPYVCKNGMWQYMP